MPALAPREDEAILDKLAFSAFEGTPLAMILRDCGLSAFAIVGSALTRLCAMVLISGLIPSRSAGRIW